MKPKFWDCGIKLNRKEWWRIQDCDLVRVTLTIPCVKPKNAG
jgi:hypothetical protein